MDKIAECIKIYREAFGDGDTVFEENLFKNCFKHCKYTEADGKAVAMLFAIPCEIITEQNNISAIYIYAAATLKEYRSKGYMSELIESLKKGNNAVLFLRPENQNLIGFYKSLGFKRINAVSNEDGYPIAKPISHFALLAEEADFADGSEFTAMYYSKENINIDNLHFIYSME